MNTTLNNTINNTMKINWEMYTIQIQCICISTHQMFLKQIKANQILNLCGSPIRRQWIFWALTFLEICNGHHRLHHHCDRSLISSTNKTLFVWNCSVPVRQQICSILLETDIFLSYLSHICLWPKTELQILQLKKAAWLWILVINALFEFDKFNIF